MSFVRVTECPLTHMVVLNCVCSIKGIVWLRFLGCNSAGREKEKINKFSVSKVRATFKIIRQINLFHKCLHFQMPLFGAFCCHCLWHLRKLASSSFRCSRSYHVTAMLKDYTCAPVKINCNNLVLWGKEGWGGGGRQERQVLNMERKALLYCYIQWKVITEKNESCFLLLAGRIREFFSSLKLGVHFDIIGSRIIYDINCCIIDCLSALLAVSPSFLPQKASSAQTRLTS